MRKYKLDGSEVVERYPAEHCPDYDGVVLKAIWEVNVLVITETEIRGSCNLAHGMGRDYFGVNNLPFSPRGELKELRRTFRVSPVGTEFLSVELTQKERTGPEAVTSSLTYRKKR
jgi:hypothetical protein